MKVLVVGDIIVDRYTHGRKLGVSAETPTVVGRLTKEEMFVGGAGLVVRNLLRLGVDVTLVTAINEPLLALFDNSTDPPNNKELNSLRPIPFPVVGFKASEKRRYYIDSYKMVQYDSPNEGKWDAESEEGFIGLLEQTIEGYHLDAVVVCDNRHGVLNENIAKAIIKVCRKNKIMTYVDVQWSQSFAYHTWYKGADWIFVNEYELEGIGTQLSQAALKRMKKRKSSLVGEVNKFLDCNLVHKRGERGAILCRKNGETIVSNGFKVEAVDTCGAGDAFMAAFVATGKLDAADAWAAASTLYRGTIVPKWEDMGVRIKENEPNTLA